MDVFERIESRLEAIEALLATIEANIKRLEPRLGKIEESSQKMAAHIDFVEETYVSSDGFFASLIENRMLN